MQSGLFQNEVSSKSAKQNIKPATNGPNASARKTVVHKINQTLEKKKKLALPCVTMAQSLHS